MNKVLAIGWMNLSRLIRDRTAVFFVFVFPLLIILVLGATFGEAFTPKVGVYAPGSGRFTTDLVTRLEARDGLEVVGYTDAAKLQGDVERGRLEGGVIVPATYDSGIRSQETVEVRFLARPTGSGQELRLTVTELVDDQAVVIQAARLAVLIRDLSWDEALAAAEAAQTSTPRTEVVERVAGSEEAGYSQAAGAAQELVLFMYVTSLSASSMLIESRKLGCSRRMLASPTRVGQILAGEALGRYLIALLQGLLIVAGTIVLFGVEWGDPAATAVTVALFAATATGAAMLMGSVLRNEQQAGAMGVFLGLGLAALGGAMVPLEVFSPVMDKVAHLTPHAWAIESLGEVQAGGGIGDIGSKLAILGGYAVVLLAVSSLMLRRALTAGRAT